MESRDLYRRCGQRINLRCPLRGELPFSSSWSLGQEGEPVPSTSSLTDLNSPALGLGFLAFSLPVQHSFLTTGKKARG